MQKFENQPISGVTSMAASQHCLEILLILVTKLYKYSFFIIWAHVMCNYLLSWDYQKKYYLQTQISHKKDFQPNKNSPENIALPKFYIIVGIGGINSPPQKHHPLFLAKPPYILVFQPTPPPHPPLKLDLSLNPKNIKVFHP